jgi:hypothetical protein
MMSDAQRFWSCGSAAPEMDSGYAKNALRAFFA